MASVETILGKSTKIEGKLVSEGAVRIDGSLEGEVHIEGDLVVGEGGQVKATVSVHNLLVVGVINGDVTTSGKLEIAPTGKIEGDVQTVRLIVEAGGVIQGNCKMAVPEDT
ncbi:MAG TPA: polymer-forming cytoskeletal protein [Firmicutes bacterium]|nr:polymer-forming cytoskeletal protein [Bacillota bacterium]